MQVKAISAPVEALGSRFGSSARSLFLSVGEEVAAFTHRGDDERGGYAAADQPSVWLGLPVGRDVLVAAWMIDGLRDVGADGLAAMTADQVREWTFTAVLWLGTERVKQELASPEYASGYRHCADDDDHELPGFFALVSARVDEAFGLGAHSYPDERSMPSPRPAPTRALARV